MIFHRKMFWLTIYFATVIAFTPGCSFGTPPRDVIAIENIDLRSVYRRLKYAGFKPGPFYEDDLSRLSAAIRRFQKIAKLETTGILDTYTWELLQKLYDPKTSESTGAKPEHPSSDTKGPAPASAMSPSKLPMRPWPAGVVKAVQKMLLNQNFNPGTLDGRLTPTTQNAIEQFQKAYGFTAGGRLDLKTLSYLIDAHCKDGCELGTLEFTQAEVMDLAGLPTDEVSVYAGTSLERIYLQAIEKILNILGYDCGLEDGIIGQQTRQAIAKFKREHGIGVGGQLDKKVAQAILSAYCEPSCRFSIAIRKPRPVQGGARALKPLDKRRITLQDMPVDIGDAVFAVEKVECSDFSGDYIIFYQGVVTEKKDEWVWVRLAKRYCYYYRPDKQGVNSSDWWCIPVRRHCYSEIKFNAWKGKLHPNQVEAFFQTKVFNARIEIVTGFSQILQQACQRRF
jgi:peptidoglycan hydrolase-like protein with peptidoglycan-binding domain